MSEKRLCYITCNFVNRVINKIKEYFLSFAMLISVIFCATAFFFAFQPKYKDRDLFTCAAVLISAIAIFYQADRNKKEDNKENSKFYLENYKQTADMILIRLNSDTPTRRISWITASEIAHKLIDLEKKITESADKEILEIHQRNLAHEIHEIFDNKPAIYFTGTGKDDALSLEEALQRTDIIASGSLTLPPLPYIPKENIIRILKITDSIWEKEMNYQDATPAEFEKILKYKYPKLYEYFKALDASGRK